MMSSCRGVRARRRGDRSARAGTRGTQTRAPRRAGAACRESCGMDTQKRQRREEQQRALAIRLQRIIVAEAPRSRGRLNQKAGDPAAGHHVRDECRQHWATLRSRSALARDASARAETPENPRCRRRIAPFWRAHAPLRSSKRSTKRLRSHFARIGAVAPLATAPGSASRARGACVL